MSDPYKVLGVSPNATDEEIKAAYRELARKYHPDNYVNNPLGDLAAEKMKEINEAYDQIQASRKAGNQGGYGGYNGGYQGAYGNSCPAAYFLNMLHISMAGIVYIDVAYPCVPPFRFSVRPACGFNTLIPHPGSSFHHFLKCPSIQDSAYKPYLHPIPLRLS